LRSPIIVTGQDRFWPSAACQGARRERQLNTRKQTAPARLKRTAPARSGVAGARGRRPSQTTRTVMLRPTGHSLDCAGQEPGLRSSAQSQIMNSGSPPPRSAYPHTAEGLSETGPQPQPGEAQVCSRPHGGWWVECVSAGHRSRALHMCAARTAATTVQAAWSRLGVARRIVTRRGETRQTPGAPRVAWVSEDTMSERGRAWSTGRARARDHPHAFATSR
jgi:hypothetical protein